MAVGSRQVRRLYGIIIALSVLTALGAFAARFLVERADNTVGIMVDYYATRQLANQAGQPLSAVLRSYRNAGVWGVGLEELTVEEAAHEGMLMLLDGWEAGPALQGMGMGTLPVKENNTYIVWWPDSTPQWLVRSMRLHIEPWARQIAGKDGLVVWEIPALPPYVGDSGAPVSAVSVRSIGLGLAETAVSQIRAAGLAVVPRFMHTPSITDEQVRFRLSQMSSPLYAGVPIVFAGQRVAGFPDLEQEWVSGMRNRQIPIGLVEFIQQPGSAQVTKGIGFRGIRLHAITGPEMAQIDLPTALARWARAVRERDIRLLYVRPFPVENPLISGKPPEKSGSLHVVNDELLQKNIDYVQDIANTIQADGYHLGAPAPMQPIPFPWPLLLVLAAGAAAGGWLLLVRFVRLPERLGWAIVILAVGLFALVYLKGYTTLARQVYALVAAIVFPTLGALLAYEYVGHGKGLIKAYWIAAGISLIGAVHVVGFLSDVRFMLKVEQFAGVKLAHVGPPGLMMLAVLLGPLPLVLSKSPDSLWSRVRRIFSEQVPVRYLIIAGVAGLAGLVYLVRTGNEGMPVLGVEQQFRQLLEVVLLARPRTKEFLIGHPLLVAALDQHMKGRKGLAGWLMVGAVVGQLSMVNTFSHIHTPLWMSSLRTGTGLVLGLAVGWFIVRPLVEWFARRALVKAQPTDSGVSL